MQLERYFSIECAVLTNSWTNGALATLLALGIGPGDEIIVPAITFIATSNVVELLGAKPVFVDVDPETLLITPKAVRAALTPSTKAVFIVHLFGQMADTAGIAASLSDRPDIHLLEDAAHCFEGTRNGERPGKHSKAAFFSFYATKNITCGEGGAVITRDLALMDKVRQTILHGMSVGAADRFKQGAYQHWDMLRLGVKANLPDLLAALLPSQIDAVETVRWRRAELAEKYTAAFVQTPLRLVRIEPGVVHAHHLFPIHVPPAVRDTALQRLNTAGIGTTVNYRAVPTLTYYREKYGYVPEDHPVSQNWGEGAISLPLFPGMSGEEQNYVIEKVMQEVVPLCS